MRRLAVVVPVKSGERKSRLSAIMGKEEREELAGLLLKDVLGAMRSSGLLPSCHVVSSDRRVLDMAGRAGARTISEAEDAGVNAAVASAVKGIGPGADILVIPSDLPLIGKSELERLGGAARSGVDVVMAPSLGFDGTNALFFRGSAPLKLSYDDDSFWKHLASAAGERLTVRVMTDPGLMFDVDSPEDLSRLARSGSRRGSAIFARRVLR